MRAQTAIAHNIANASTTGFREIRNAVGSQSIAGPGFDSRVNPVALPDSWDDSSGVMTHTGRELDIAVQGEGWIAVQDASGGEAYTRAGNLRINNAGLLETASGELVRGSGGPISIPPFEEIYIGNDGDISIVAQGQGAESLAVVDRIKLVNPPAADMMPVANGLYAMKDGSTATADARVQVASGQLESSNVNAAAALVEMIELSRSYEMQVRAMHTVDENEAAAARLMRTG
jgi:flagellar basal-body rod protein FlgF